MINWGLLLARLLGTIMSWLQATNLRNQMYILKDENEILRTALDDIQRMDNGGRISKYAKLTLDKLDGIE
jgi:predicted KAP-like P-loop ATPase